MFLEVRPKPGRRQVPARRRLKALNYSRIGPHELTSLGLLPQTPAPEKEHSVANTKSAEKAARQAEKHRSHNVTLRSRMRTAIRKVTDAVAKGNKDDAQSSYRAAVPLIDTLVNKRIIHR